MASLREEAQNYEAPSMKNITDLEVVSLDQPVMEVEKGKGEDAFTVDVMVINNEEYRVPKSVLNEIKLMLKNFPDAKTVKVTKSGTGMSTRYRVDRLE